MASWCSEDEHQMADTDFTVLCKLAPLYLLVCSRLPLILSAPHTPSWVTLGCVFYLKHIPLSSVL